jgi:hypothetical protein
MQNENVNQLDHALRQLIREEIQLYFRDSDESDIKKIPRNLSVSIFGWRKSKEKLKRFYYELLSRGFINSSYEDFEPIFLGNPKPIYWLSSLKNLVYIFDRLIFIDAINKKENFHVLLVRNFLNGKNQHLNANTLKSTLNRIKNGKTSKELDTIIAFCK